MPETIDTILSEVKELKSWLYGQNGFKGDIPEIKDSFKSLKEEQDCLRTKQEKLNRKFWTLVGVLVGSGIIGTSAALKILGA